MGWAINYIKKLKLGETVSFRPYGNSMLPKIKSGQLCTISPVEAKSLITGDIVLCKVKGREYLHLITAIKGNRVQISNNHGFVNGWIGPNSIYGRLIEIED